MAQRLPLLTPRVRDAAVDHHGTVGSEHRSAPCRTVLPGGAGNTEQGAGRPVTRP
ncbi:hypothetical protein H4W79_004176 [Nocardiopsis terrae]|uniref:Uncharacterized protein n=1 Tax=Nocardiopsis terrae TaxID=372655 RepID=A0ABR9HLS9_9ACTN|nr:hypothetical protein [Nocardiopsis terrae]MBE1459962.1 hypothetical protein [Nocardiopsis terrae]